MQTRLAILTVYVFIERLKDLQAVKGEELVRVFFLLASLVAAIRRRVW